MFLHKFSVPDLKASTLAVDANRRIIVADSANRCIHVISLDTGEAMFFVCLFVDRNERSDRGNYLDLSVTSYGPELACKTFLKTAII